MRTVLFLIFTTLFLLIAVAGNIGSIGYFLYLWGASGMLVGTAAWVAFTSWLKLLAIAFLSLLGMIITREP